MKKILHLGCIIAALLVTTHSFAQNEFITEWKFTNATSSIKVYAITTGSVSYTYSASPSGNTGSGSFNNAANINTDIAINAAAGDVVTLKVGSANLNQMGLGFSPVGGQLPNRNDLLKVTQWGTVSWKSLETMFSYCFNFNITATDAPDLSSSGISMRQTFYAATALNADLNNWETKNVTTMNAAFQKAASFNGDISNWDVNKVTSFNGMFTNCSAFNKDISGWQINTTSNVDMGAMFSSCSAFNQNLSSWDMSKVTTIGSMFWLCSNFNQNLGSWNLNSLTNAFGTFYQSGMSCENYGLTLAGWDDNSNTPNNVNANNQSGMTYSNAAASKRSDLISTKNWTIDSDNPAASGTACYNQSLSVGFGNLTATLNHGNLVLNWNTLSEENTSHFVVEASQNGENFTKIGSVTSKAKEGFSHGELEYNFSVNTNSIAWMGLYAVALLGLAVGFTKRKDLSCFCRP